MKLRCLHPKGLNCLWKQGLDKKTWRGKFPHYPKKSNCIMKHLSSTLTSETWIISNTTPHFNHKWLFIKWGLTWDFHYTNSHHLQQVIPLGLELLLPVELVLTVTGQQVVAPCGDEIYEEHKVEVGLTLWQTGRSPCRYLDLKFWIALLSPPKNQQNSQKADFKKIK